MIFRQIFDHESYTYSYLIAERPGGEALLIDSVLEKVPQYLQLTDELELKLVIALDTHIHADHVTGLGALRDTTDCATSMGEKARADCVTYKLRDGERVKVDGIRLVAMATPEHTDGSFSFQLPDRVLTGYTLLIRGTGRTDFQNGDPWVQYDSLFNKLLRLPDKTLVYPAHDYNGMTVSTIGEEKRHNPRLQVRTVDEYAELMNSLKLDDPRMMDVAVPANLTCGKTHQGKQSSPA